jgi:succinoglycan biosynthesis protein ExoU
MRAPMSSEGQVAVVIAAYNAGSTLERAIASVLAQPETAEVCVVDDASCDATLALAQAWSVRDGRVCAYASMVNGGPGAARNLAIANTRAPWIAVIDADDYILPGRFSTLLGAAGGADFVADALIRTTEGAEPGASLSTFQPETLNFEAFVLGNLGRSRGPLDLGFLKPLMRRAFLEAHGLGYQPTLRLGEDYEFYARALALGARFLVGNPAGYVSIERPGSLSKDHTEGDLERLRDCDHALAQIRTLTGVEKHALARHWASVDCRLQWRRLISAVKTRDLRAAVATFRSPETAIYLAGKLSEQAWRRSISARRRA